MLHKCGVVRLSRSKCSRVSGTPASCAIAIKCRTVFEDPPRAISTRTAFSSALTVTISLGRTCCFTRPTTRWPLSYAIRCFALRTAIAVAHIGSDKPMASVRHAIVFAVYIPWQEPHVGQASASRISLSLSAMSPALNFPTASNVSVIRFSRRLL